MDSVGPLGRDHAIALVEQGRFPITFGTPPSVVAVVEQDGKFRIRELVIDRAEAEAAAASAAGRARTPSWMPEHHYTRGKPTGQILAEAATREALVEQMRTIACGELVRLRAARARASSDRSSRQR